MWSKYYKLTERVQPGRRFLPFFLFFNTVKSVGRMICARSLSCFSMYYPFNWWHHHICSYWQIYQLIFWKGAFLTISNTIFAYKSSAKRAKSKWIYAGFRRKWKNLLYIPLYVFKGRIFDDKQHYFCILFICKMPQKQRTNACFSSKNQVTPPILSHVFK